MPKYLFILFLCISLTLRPDISVAQTSEWIKREKGLWYLPTASLPGSDAASVTAMRFNRLFFEYELILSEAALRAHDLDLKKTMTALELQSDEFSVSDYSLRNLWRTFSSDHSVVAIIPIGYVEASGFPEYAGFLRVDGRSFKGIMSAPNLTALLCFNNERFRTESDSGPFEGQAPWLFGVRYDPSNKYRYVEGFDQIIFSKYYDANAPDGVPNDVPDEYLARSNSWFRSSFSGVNCKDMAQVGPRLIEPHLFSSYAGQHRLGVSETSPGSISPHHTVVLSYDLNGHLTVTVSQAPVSNYELANAISSDWFYPHGCTWTLTRSRSCELWAVALTGWDHSGMIVRDMINPDSFQQVGGKGQNVPAIIVLRSRANPGQPRGDDEIRIENLEE